MNERAAYFLGSVAMLVGAIAIGGVLHQALVESSIAPTSPQAVLGVLGGLFLIALGWRLERGVDPADFVTVPDQGEGDGDEFEEADYIFSDEELEPRSDSDVE